MKFKPFTVGAVLMYKHGIADEKKPKKKWMGSKPETCDLCGENVGWALNKQWFVDGKTRMGPWAILCPRCFEMYGVGLGTGRGQKYDLKTLEKLEG